MLSNLQTNKSLYLLIRGYDTFRRCFNLGNNRFINLLEKYKPLTEKDLIKLVIKYSDIPNSVIYHNNIYKHSREVVIIKQSSKNKSKVRHIFSYRFFISEKPSILEDKLQFEGWWKPKKLDSKITDSIFKITSFYTFSNDGNKEFSWVFKL